MADTDLLTLEAGKEALRLKASDTTRDVQLQRVITAVSGRLDEMIGPTVFRSISGEEHNVPTWRPWVRTFQYPVAEWGTVIEWSGTTSQTVTRETPGSEPSASYRAERYEPDPSLFSGTIFRRISGADSVWPIGGWVVTSYTAGRVASTAEVPDRIAEGAVLTLRNAWRSYEITVGRTGDGGEYGAPRQGFPTFAVPRAAMELLHDLLQDEDSGMGGIA